MDPGRFAVADRMQRIPLERKWWPFYLACGFAVVLQAIFFAITWPSIRARFYGLPASLTWREIVLTHAVTFAVGLAQCLYPLFHMLPEISTEGIWRRGFVGLTYIRWQDVIDVSAFTLGHGYYIDIRTRNKKLRVIPGFYKNPQDLISTIKERVPKQALTHLPSNWSSFLL